MPDFNSFEINILEDFSDVTRQYVYADYLEEQNEPILASYVRLCAVEPSNADELGVQFRQRRVLLDKDPKCWGWQTFLAQKKFPQIRDWLDWYLGSDHELNRRASLEQVLELESLLGCELPIFYREFLLRVTDNAVMEEGDNLDFLSVATIISKIKQDDDAVHLARQPAKLTWADTKQCVKELPLEGTLMVTPEDNGFFSLVLNGELAGGVVSVQYDTEESWVEHDHQFTEYDLESAAGGLIPTDIVSLTYCLARDAF